jgi:predicted enzyme related to lactoylglutathione lyase
MTILTSKRAPGEPNWTDLSTPDLDKAKAFYSELFGWEFFDSGPDFGHYNMALLQGQSAAGIGPSQPGSEMPSAWTVYFSSDDAAADAARAAELGGMVIMDAMPVGELGVMAICADPTGAVFGLWQAGQHIGASIEDEPGTMAWSEVNTRESVKASEFYSKLFHLTPSKVEGAEYFQLQRDGKSYCGVLQMDEQWGDMPPHWMQYFAVTDTDAIAEKAAAVGGTVHVPPFDTPYGRIAVIGDPLGAVFSIMKPPSA